LEGVLDGAKDAPLFWKEQRKFEREAVYTLRILFLKKYKIFVIIFVCFIIKFVKTSEP
jgi:hypothetical protein